MIPLSIPNISGNEWKYVKDCLDTGWISSVGSYVNLFEEKVAEFTGAKYAVAAMNGTAALHLSLQLAGVRQGDLVIVPDITFVASCNAIAYLGAEPLLIDVDPLTWQMDLDILEEFLDQKSFTVGSYDESGNEVLSSHIKDTGRRIGAIMPVHVLGNMVDMDRLMALSEKYHLPVVEDSTEALGSYYKGKHAGTFGIFGTLSFNGNKIISTGGGGMILTNDANLAKKAKHLTTQAKTDPFEYDHDAIGYNYRLVNILAAVGVAQMEQLPGFLKRKKEIDAYYRNELESENLKFQKVTDGVEPNNWLHTMWVEHQRPLIEHLLKNEVQCRPFWVPMHQLEMFKSCTFVSEKQISEQVYRHCISIPSSTGLTDDQVHKVAEVIKAFYI
ncbi:MAG: LegC family aminotransferase [Saprospiraceae bacterium]|nr:LegC family aminotransferase [Saprospiraceae bacterium]